MTDSIWPAIIAAIAGIFGGLLGAFGPGYMQSINQVENYKQQALVGWLEPFPDLNFTGSRESVRDIMQARQFVRDMNYAVYASSDVLQAYGELNANKCWGSFSNECEQLFINLIRALRRQAGQMRLEKSRSSNFYTLTDSEICHQDFG